MSVENLREQIAAQLGLTPEVLEAAKKHQAERPGETDQDCANCGIRWWNRRGRDGEVYCDICLGRGRDEPQD